MSTQSTIGEQESVQKKSKFKVTSFIALFLALVFFSGSMGQQKWFGWDGWGVFDFTTLNGSFGRVVSNVVVAPKEIKKEATPVTTPTQAGSAVTAGPAEAANAEAIKVIVKKGPQDLSETEELKLSKSAFRGAGGRGAMDGFLFAFGLIPTVMFALAMISVFESFGALDAAGKLLTPILKPILGISGSAALALIGSLQSTDVGASLTRQLSDEKQLTEDQRDAFLMFQFSGGAMITNFFSSGVTLFTTIILIDGTSAIPASIGLCLVVIFIMKIFGANLFRLIMKFTSKDNSATAKE